VPRHLDAAQRLVDAVVVTSAIDGSKNRVRYTPVSSSTMKLYSATSPSRNDQWVGNTLLSCRRSAADGW
jgi:hypothetical protein